MPAIKLAVGLALSIIALGGTASAQSDPTGSMSPQGNWAVEFAEDSCGAIRSFSSAGGDVMLSLRSYEPGKFVTMEVMSNSLPLRVGTPKVGFLPEEAPTEVDYFLERRGEDGWRGVSFTQKRPEQPDVVKAIAIRGVFRDEIVLATGALGALSNVLAECEDDLMTGLGLDAAALRNLKREVGIDWDDADWLKVTVPMQRDFSRTGSTFQQVRLLVDEMGKVFGCRLLVGNTDNEIAARMCEALTEDAEFEPALDAQSKPIKGYYRLFLSTGRSSKMSR